MLQTIIAISGKPGLYRLLSHGKNTLIVETIDAEKKRKPIFASDSVTRLSDISMYTTADDVPLSQVLDALCTKEEGKPTTLNFKKCSSAELRSYFATVLPTFDADRVHDSDIKKLLQWYNILVNNGLTDFKDTAEE